jgi:acyl CoA:acetate/3-ketoacid CoA transferase
MWPRLYNATKVVRRRAAVIPNSINSLYSTASVLTNTLLRLYYHSQHPLDLTLIYKFSGKSAACLLGLRAHPVDTPSDTAATFYTIAEF